MLGDPLLLSTLLPDSLDFASYAGSLTTPPCSESVLWTLLTQPLPIAPATFLHLEALHARALNVTPVDFILFNDRPLQAVNGRSVVLRRDWVELPRCDGEAEAGAGWLRGSAVLFILCLLVGLCR